MRTIRNVGWLLASTSKREEAVSSFTGATDATAFESFVRLTLCPTLRKGDLVVMDRLKAHRGPVVRELIEAQGARLLYLPPYSPDLNPIEKVWSKLKALVRKAKARTREALWEAIAKALEAITPQDCQGCFAFCGYHATPECKTL